MLFESTLNTFSRSGVNARIVYAGNELKDYLSKDLSANYELHPEELSIHNIENFLKNQSLLTLPDILILEADFKGEWINVVSKIKSSPLLGGMIIIVLSAFVNSQWKKKAISLKVHDYYNFPFPTEDLSERLSFLVKFKLIKPTLTELSGKVDVRYRLPTYKRAFDIIASGSALILLTPLFLIVAACIALESKGPIIYKSKRVGTGYRIFDFYKFRSMRANAEKEIDQLSSLNQYTDKEKGKSTFVKIKGDPRITKIGKFIRMTSIDELPQLFNVLIGDMSMVGNRPLPLYEAQMLTSNEWTTRFLGPAGLTGLWQISRRGKEDMSERERKKLDNFYANNYSFWLDLKILLKTFPALLQKEKV